MKTKIPLPIPTEYQEHMAFMDWVELHPKIRELIIHIPNEYDGGAIKGKRRADMGVKRGVSDFLLPLPTKTHHGLWIELKRRKHGVESSEQRAWINKMRTLGYDAHFCYGCSEAIEKVNAYLGLKPR
jgi:hypothetical protein